MAQLTFPEDGWYRFEKFEQVLFVRGTPYRPLLRAGHYHQDLGHFSLYKLGRPVLIDGGRRHYLNDKWGRFGLLPEAHNTITVDDYGLSPYRPTRFPGAYSDTTYSVSNMETDQMLQVQIKTSGFCRIHPALMWCRTIEMFQEEFVLQDFIYGNDQRSVTTFFHFSNPINVVKKDKNSLEFKDPVLSGVIQHDYANGGQPNIYRAGESLFGWQAVSYGKVLPAPTVVFRESVKLPVKCNYKIKWSRS